MSKLVQCDVSELTNIPHRVEADMWEELEGTQKQVKWAVVLRMDCMAAWRDDLTDAIFYALGSIKDATWWIANKDADVATIRWPEEWTGNTSAENPIKNDPQINEALKVYKHQLENPPKLAARAADIQEFEEFARKVCRSPELAYMTMLALFYDKTKDKRVMDLLQVARGQVDKHINAIDRIAGLCG